MWSGCGGGCSGLKIIGQQFKTKEGRKQKNFFGMVSIFIKKNFHQSVKGFRRVDIMCDYTRDVNEVDISHLCQSRYPGVVHSNHFKVNFFLEIFITPLMCKLVS